MPKQPGHAYTQKVPTASVAQLCSWTNKTAVLQKIKDGFVVEYVWETRYIMYDDILQMGKLYFRVTWYNFT